MLIVYLTPGNGDSNHELVSQSGSFSLRAAHVNVADGRHFQLVFILFFKSAT